MASSKPIIETAVKSIEETAVQLEKMGGKFEHETTEAARRLRLITAQLAQLTPPPTKDNKDGN